MSDPVVELVDSHLQLTWPDGHRCEFHVLWLRDNCPDDRDALTGQRLVDITDLPPDPQIAAIELRPGGALVHWAGEDKHSDFSYDWLRANCVCNANRPRPLVAIELWNAQESGKLCWMDYGAVRDDRRARLDWLRALARHGIAFLRGVPASQTELLKVASFLGFITETNYGRVFDVRAVADPNNLAYTSLALGVHTDNPYRDPVPGYQVLHCLEASPDGGASVFVDGFAAAEELRSREPDAFQILIGTPVHFAFRDGEAELSAERPLIQTGPAGELRAVHYNNRSIAPLRIFGSEAPLFYRAYRRFAELLRNPRFELRVILHAGQLVAFDNHRLLHGRTAFTGPRHLQGCYVNRDGLLSNIAVLSRELS